MERKTLPVKDVTAEEKTGMMYVELLTYKDMMDKRKSFAVLRIVFGLVWLVDAYFKWQPDFTSQFVGYVTGALDGQPPLVQGWINLWIHLIGVNPTFFAYAVAVIETAIALGLILGVFSRLTCYGGILFSLVIWSTAEGFGGPYAVGSTDIGGAVIYVLVFIALLLGESENELSLDKLLREKFPREKSRLAVQNAGAGR